MAEPIGWIYEDDEGRITFSQMPQNPPLWEPVYRAAPKREWQDIKEHEIEYMFIVNPYCDDMVVYEHIANEIEAKLKERNA